MINVDVDFKIDPQWLKELEEKQATALDQTVDQVYADLVMSQTVPMDTGTLQNVLTEPIREGDAVYLASEGPYARRLYFHPEFNFRRDKNPNAGARWFDPYLPGHDKGEFVIKTYAELLKRLM